MKQEQKDKMNGLDPKIDAIKEIIFGSNIQEYNEQFDELRSQLTKQGVQFKAEISSLKKELKQQISELERELERSEARVKIQMEKGSSDLKNSKADKKLLAKLLNTMADKLST